MISIIFQIEINKYMTIMIISTMDGNIVYIYHKINDKEHIP